MTVVTGEEYGVGMRRAVWLSLNSSGSPAATGETAYEGTQMTGAKTFEINIPEAQKKSHLGDDRVIQVDYLPPTEAVSGTLTVSEENLALLATVQDVKVITLGEMKGVPIGTSQQGLEPQGGLLLTQQALSDEGVRNYRTFVFPKVTLYPRPGGMNENPGEHQFTISPAVVSKHLWETALAAATDGCTEMQGMIIHSTYIPKMIAFLATTGSQTFALPSAAPAKDTNKMLVVVDGTVQAATEFTPTTTNVSLSTTPGNNKRVMVFYES